RRRPPAGRGRTVRREITAVTTPLVRHRSRTGPVPPGSVAQAGLVIQDGVRTGARPGERGGACRGRPLPHVCHPSAVRCPPCAPTRPPKTSTTSRKRPAGSGPDRKSTRLNSSHVKISYAVFCLKKKK